MDGAQQNKKYARTTKAQLKWYVEFIQSNPHILNGKNTPNDPQAQKRLWDEVALNLNSFYGPKKTAAKWKESLSNWKKQLRYRTRKLKAERLRTGGAPFSGEELSEFEEQALSAFGMGAVNGSECVTLGLPGIFTTPATPSPLNEEEAYLFEDTLSESPTELTVDPNTSNIASASDALPSITPTTSRQQKVIKDAIYKMIAEYMQSQRRRDEQLSSALMQMGKGLEILGNAISKLADKL